MHYDAIVIGGSFAGLSGAMMLARARRSVLVIDAGAPRNRFAAHAHGVLALDGRPGSEILADARAQLAAYSTVRMLRGEVASASGHDGTFLVRAKDGNELAGGKLLLATGVTDVLPDVPGLAERWGKTVLHCPYCHGYEIGGGPIGLLSNTPMSVQHAGLIADWGEVTLFTNGPREFTEAERATLGRRHVRVEPGRVARLEGEGSDLEGLRLEDGPLVPVRALFVSPHVEVAGPIARELGCALDDTPVGRLLRTDAEKMTTVAGVYAAGDATLARTNITLAAADGVRAGLGLHHALIAKG